MSDESKWASYVRAHRLAQNLNQSQFAVVMGVSQQTVSRWESGGQVPEPAMQDKLKMQLRVTALNSIQFWKRRVALASGFDMLIGADLTILASSARVGKLLNLGENALAGVALTDVLPNPKIQDAGQNRVRTIDNFREIGFFDGLIRSIRLDMEWHLQSGSCSCRTDVWPVMTSDQVILGHLSGSPVPILAAADGFMGILVNKITVRLNKDAEA
jgi:transcriptional regulator with XRE-family HTH domain